MGLFSVEADYFTGNGEDAGTLVPGATLRVKSINVTGPLDVTSDFRLQMAQLRAVGGGRFGDVFEVEGMLGVALREARLQLEVSGLHETVREREVVPAAGARLSLDLGSGVRAYGQVNVSASDDTGVVVMEAGVRLGAGGTFGVSGGWREAQVELERGGESDLEFELSGLFVNLDLEF